MKPAINLWAQFLKHEKLDAAALTNEWKIKLVELCAELAKDGAPKLASHKDTLESRRKVCVKAFSLSMDLMKAKRRGAFKPAMGRGLLDVWNIEYKKQYGGNIGTAGMAEVSRRTVSTRLALHREDEAFLAAIAESKPRRPIEPAEWPFIINKAIRLCGSIEAVAERLGWTVDQVRERAGWKPFTAALQPGQSQPTSSPTTS